MRRWIAFVLLAGIVLVVAGTACSSKKTATSTEAAKANNTSSPAPANTASRPPTDTPPPPAPTQAPVQQQEQPAQQPQQLPPTQPPQANCDSSYPDVCIPPPPPDLDCGEISYRRFRVLPPDPHGFDRDSDGIGCESG